MQRASTRKHLSYPRQAFTHHIFPSPNSCFRVNLSSLVLGVARRDGWQFAWAAPRIFRLQSAAILSPRSLPTHAPSPCWLQGTSLAPTLSGPCRPMSNTELLWLARGRTHAGPGLSHDRLLHTPKPPS